MLRFCPFPPTATKTYFSNSSGMGLAPLAFTSSAEDSDAQLRLSNMALDAGNLEGGPYILCIFEFPVPNKINWNKLGISQKVHFYPFPQSPLHRTEIN